MVDEKLAENRKRYEKKRIFKNASFNTETEGDLLEYADSLDFSQRGNPSRAALLHSFRLRPNPPDPTISASTVTLYTAS